MRVSRLAFWASFTSLMLFLLLALGTSGCHEKVAKRATGSRIVDCAKTITVDANNGVIAKHETIYVCEDYPQVTWTRGPGVTTFTVHFPPNNCPFNPCNDITESQPTATLGTLPADLKVYKYSITVNNLPSHDPHVVGGGGY